MTESHSEITMANELQVISVNGLSFSGFGYVLNPVKRVSFCPRSVWLLQNQTKVIASTHFNQMG